MNQNSLNWFSEPTPRRMLSQDAVTDNPDRRLPCDVTTVAHDMVVVHATRDDGTVKVIRRDGLTPDRSVEVEVKGVGTVTARTLARPPGELLSTVVTVNDVHFGERAAGQINDVPVESIRRSPPGGQPYPELMNRAAAAEIAAIEPDAVVVKGDLSVDGTEEEWAAFEACYRTTFLDRLHVVRGNHDAYRGQDRYAGHKRIVVDGLVIALLDTVIPEKTTGQIDADTAAWLDTVAAEADRPVIAMGHHQQWIGEVESSARRSDGYFGLHPKGSDLLDSVCVRRPSILAYTAGHTHRHRRRRMTRSGVASIEVGCVKDFPGTWAEHRVYDGGVVHLVHRISDFDALRWSESCRHLYTDFGVDYERYALGSLKDRCFVLGLRS